MKAANLILQETYLANALVNPRGIPQIFYEIDSLLEHQNAEFKQSRADRGLFLQENNEIFWFYALSVDILKKVRSSINQIVINREKNGYHS